MGYEQIANLTEMKQLFWELAIRRVTMGRAFRAAIKAITTEETALKYFSRVTGPITEPSRSIWKILR